ncbi:MAG: PAS domain S-box protein [Bacteroidales bacterium]
MKFLNNIKIKHRILLVVTTLLVLLFSAAAFTVYSFSLKRLLNTTQTQMEVYLQKISDIITEIDKQTPDGFSHQDYAQLKNYFNKPAFYSTDYPFLVSKEGNYLIHLYREGQKYPTERLNRVFADPNKEGFFEYYQEVRNERHKIIVYFKKIDSYDAFIAIPVNFSEITEDLKTNRIILLLIIFAGITLSAIAINYALRPVIKTISKINSSLTRMAEGDTPQKIQHSTNDEVGQIASSLNKLIAGLSRTAEFATQIGQNNLNTEYAPLGPNDALGNSLLSMRANLKKASLEEQERKQEDQRRNWVNSGLAKFGDILRQNNDELEALSDNVTQELVNYLNANQGGLFIVNENEDNEHELELLSTFAYNRKKSKKKTILFGEGLVGNCAVEKQTIYLKEIPEDYIEITSGLGEAPPRTLLIVPLKLEEKVFGVIELASFNNLSQHEIEFVEKIGENIASTLSAVKNSIRTTQLLEQSQQQREEMAAQEEEMRQNMEEMQATQEEMARKTIEMEGITSAINEALLFCELSESGNFQFANLNFLEKFGHTKDSIEELTIKEFIHPDDTTTFNEAWNTITKGETFKGTLKWLNKYNEEFYTLASITPAFDENNELYKIFYLGQDITDSKNIELKARQQAEEIEQNLIKLQEEQKITKQQEEEIAALLQALDNTCLVTEISPEGEILFINNKNVETLGDSKDKIEGKLHHELDFEAKTKPEKYKKFWNSILEGNIEKRDFSLNVKGKTVWISEQYTPIRDKSGKVVKIINLGINITESKEKELMLQKQIDELMNQLRKNK